MNEFRSVTVRGIEGAGSEENLYRSKERAEKAKELPEGLGRGYTCEGGCVVRGIDGAGREEKLNGVCKRMWKWLHERGCERGCEGK